MRLSALNPATHPKEFLRHLFDVAVKRALPLENTAAFLPNPPKAGRTVVIGAGKAGGAMAQAVEALWPQDLPLEGLVVTRYHHTPPRPAGLVQRIEVVEAAHPVPDAAGMQASERMLALVQALSAAKQQPILTKADRLLWQRRFRVFSLLFFLRMLKGLDAMWSMLSGMNIAPMRPSFQASDKAGMAWLLPHM